MDNPQETKIKKTKILQTLITNLSSESNKSTIFLIRFCLRLKGKSFWFYLSLLLL